MRQVKTLSILILLVVNIVCVLSGCRGAEREYKHNEREALRLDSISQRDAQIRDSIEYERTRPLSLADIKIKKAYLFEEYLLEDSYPYKDTVRVVQWDKIKEGLAIVENVQRGRHRWAVLQNYKNQNGEAPVVYNWHRNEYKLVSDSLNVSRYQSVPLYAQSDTVKPRRYGRDGTPVVFKDSIGGFYRVSLYNVDEVWKIPKRYVHFLPDSTTFHHVVFVDTRGQNIVTLERSEKGLWLARSTNPCTTGKHNPPYQMETPLGTFLLQQKKAKMHYTHDGSSRLAGYAPWASRFHNGGYIHGVPTNSVNGKIQEYSWSLGTEPRSHMCVRNASSHAKFIYDYFPSEETLVVVID